MSDGQRAPASEEFRREAVALAGDLYEFACHLSGSRLEAEELVQDTYARALAGSQQFASGTNLKAWLLRILRNAFFDTHRRATRSPLEAEGTAPVDAVDESTFPWGGEDHDVPRALAAHDLERALAELTPAFREIVLLDLQGLTESDTAGVLGVAPGTVKSRLARARAALRTRLAAYGG